MSYTQDFKDWLLTNVDGTVEISLLCGDSECTDGGYERQSVNFSNGSNTAEIKFGPYKANFRGPITAYCLYMDAMEIGSFELPSTQPAIDEVSVFQPGSIKLSIN